MDYNKDSIYKKIHINKENSNLFDKEKNFSYYQSKDPNFQELTINNLNKINDISEKKYLIQKANYKK